MSVARFTEIARNAKEVTNEICLHVWGEPFMHPDLEQILDTALELNLTVNLTTNGLLLNGGRGKLALHRAVRQLNFSLQSFTDNFPERDPKPYLGRLMALAQSAASERPDLYINFRLWNIDKAMTAGITEIVDVLCAELGRPDLRWQAVVAELDVRRKKNLQIAGRTYLHFDTRFVWPDLSAPVRSTCGTCHALTTHCAVLVDGTVVPCCLDSQGNIKLGKIGESGTLAEIIAQPRAQALARGFARGELVERLCQGCDFITRFDRKPIVQRRRQLRPQQLG
jgi:MoaA/NifB/PqqE/SkfB family radical SAM enzyme